jgi:hypothetical protein
VRLPRLGGPVVEGVGPGFDQAAGVHPDDRRGGADRGRVCCSHRFTCARNP